MKDRGQKANATGSKKLNSSSYNRVCLQTLKSPSVSAMKMACPSRGSPSYLAQRRKGLGSPGIGAQHSPVPTLETTASKQVLSRHLHVDSAIGMNADSVRDGFHCPKCL